MPLTMWKVIDPCCKCAAYFTAEEQEFDRHRTEGHVAALESAGPVTAIIGGKEMKLLRVFTEGGHEAYLSEAAVQESLEIWRAYLKAFAARVPVEVSACELKDAPEFANLSDQIGRVAFGVRR